MCESYEYLNMCPVSYPPTHTHCLLESTHHTHCLLESTHHTHYLLESSLLQTGQLRHFEEFTLNTSSEQNLYKSLCSCFKSRWFFLMTTFSNLLYPFRIHTWSFLLAGWLSVDLLNVPYFPFRWFWSFSLHHCSHPVQYLTITIINSYSINY